jgi:hypothetical protein
VLVTADKAGWWKHCKAEAIPTAEQLYNLYLKERGCGGKPGDVGQSPGDSAKRDAATWLMRDLCLRVERDGRRGHGEGEAVVLADAEGVQAEAVGEHAVADDVVQPLRRCGCRAAAGTALDVGQGEDPEFHRVPSFGRGVSRAADLTTSR